ncbi:MAG: hypothetical protein U1A78_26620 [Polyangia bacterium]
MLGDASKRAEYDARQRAQRTDRIAEALDGAAGTVAGVASAIERTLIEGTRTTRAVGSFLSDVGAAWSKLRKESGR